MSEEQTNFKVTDRRLFNADGSPRELSPDEKPEPASTPSAGTIIGADAAAPATADANPATPTASAGPVATPAEAKLPPEESENQEEGELPDADDPASFIHFAMSIASNAASSLGMMEHPVTHKREVDLELAKHWIDVLGMLQHKTRGNLVLEEEQILEGWLADLRMQFVSLTSTATAKAKPAFTGRDIIGN